MPSASKEDLKKLGELSHTNQTEFHPDKCKHLIVTRAKTPTLSQYAIYCTTLKMEMVHRKPRATSVATKIVATQHSYVPRQNMAARYGPITQRMTHTRATPDWSRWSNAQLPVASFAKEVNLRLAKRPLVFNRCSSSLVKEAIGWHWRDMNAKVMSLTC